MRSRGLPFSIHRRDRDLGYPYSLKTSLQRRSVSRHQDNGPKAAAKGPRMQKKGHPNPFPAAEPLKNIDFLGPGQSIAEPLRVIAED